VDGETALAALNTLLAAENLTAATNRPAAQAALALITNLGADYTAGSAAVPASAQVRVPGTNNDFTIEASARIANHIVRFEDGGPGSAVSVQIVGGIIAISIDFGSSTAAEVVAALNAPFSYATALVGGSDATAASGTLSILDSVLNVSVVANGAAANGIRVVLEGDATATALSANWVGDDATGTSNRTLTLTYIPDITTLGEIIAFLNSYTGASIGTSATSTAVSFQAALAAGGIAADVILSLGAALLTETGASALHDGSGVINPAAVSASGLASLSNDNLFNPNQLVVIDGILYLVGDYFEPLVGTTAGGTDSAAATTNLILGGESLTIRASSDGAAASDGSRFNGVEVRITANSGNGVIVRYDSVAKLLTVAYQPGVSSYQALLEAVNALPNFTLTYATSNLGEAPLPLNNVHLWRQTASGSTTLERVLPASLQLQGEVALSLSNAGLLIVDSGNGIRLLDTDDDTLTTVRADGTFTSFALMADEQIALLDNVGRALRLTIDGGSPLAAVKAQPWLELTQATAHDDALYVVDNTGPEEVLYRVDGSSAESVHSVTSGQRFEQLISVGDKFYFTTRSSSGALALFHLNTTTTVATAVILSAGLTTIPTTSITGSFHSFVALGENILFVYSVPGANRLASIHTDTPTVAAQIRDIGSGTVSEMTVVGDQAYFRFGGARGFFLWTTDLTEAGTKRATNPRNSSIQQAADPAQLVAFKGQLYFTAPIKDAGDVIWVSIPDGSGASVIETAPLIDLVDSVVPPLIISVLNDAGDGIVTAADGSADRTDVLYSADTPDQALIDVTEIVRSFLAAGKTRITFALSLNLEASLIPEDGFTIARADVANGSQLQVVTGSVASVTGSLFSEEGRLLQSNQPVIDLSQLPAGTYFLRVNGPSDAIELIQRGTATIQPSGTSLGSAKDYTYFIRENQLRRTNGFLGKTNFLDQVVRSGPNAIDIIGGADLRLIGGAGDSFYFTRVESNGTDPDQTVLWEISGQFAQRVGVITGDAEQWVAVGDTMIFNVASILYAVEGTQLTELQDHDDATISGLASVADRAVYLVTEAAVVGAFGRWHASDGTVAGTVSLDNIEAGGQAAGDVVASGGFLFYLEENAGALTLWRAQPGEGQAFGAEPLKVAALAAVDAVEWSILGVSNFNVLFTVTNADGEVQLWISNGSGDGLLGGQQPGTIQIEADLGGEAAYVGVFDNRMFFVVDGADSQSLWSTQGTSELTFVVVAELPGEARSQVVWNDETYFIAGPTLSPLLWKLTADGAEFVSFLPVFADKLTAAGDVLAFTGLFITELETGDALFVTDGTAEGVRMVVELSPVNPGRITDIAMTANGIVFIVQNNDAILDGFVDYSLWISNGFRDGTYPILSSNGGTLPFGTTGSEAIRPELLKVVGAVAFYAFDGRIIATDGTADGTRIVNPVEDIQPLEWIESDGRLVILDQNGRLWMTEGNLEGLPFRIEVKAPVSGRSHSVGDGDIINGGEGNDIIIGNGDNDMLFGGGGTNFFIAERKEIRDLQPFENFTLPPIQEFSFQQPRATDTEVLIPDVNLAAAIARALGIAVTVGFDGRPVIHGKIMASQLATLAELQAPNAGIQSVVGLQFARNLSVLNLNGNRIEDLSILVPATDTVSGAITGLSNLRVFSMDYNGGGILTFNGADEPGAGEYVDLAGLISDIQMTVTFWFRTDNFGQPMGLFSMDSGFQGAGGLDRSIFLDESGRIGAFLYSGADTGYEVIRSADDTNFANGKWHHVAYVFSSNTDVAQRLYVNGVEVAVGTVTSSSMSIQDGFNLGFAHAVAGAPAGASILAGGIPETPGEAAYFKGDLDELRIWDAAFTDVLVNADMISGYPAERVTLVGYWSFDQAPGSFVIDHSLFRRNGVMGGGNIDRAPAFNFMQPDPANRSAPGLAVFASVGPERTLFQTIIRDLGRLNVPGPLEKVSLAYNRIDVLDPLSNLPDMNFINLEGVVNSQDPILGLIFDHTDLDEPQTRLFTTKDGIVIAVEGDRTLVLSAGTWAWRRLTVGAGVDGDESFNLEIDTATDELIVTAFGTEQRFDLAAFDQILFDGGNGNDSLSITGAFPLDLYLFGGAGNDTLQGGQATNYLFGGAGNDTLSAQGGDSFLTGGQGDDAYLFFDNWGTARVNENPNGGSDTIDFSNVTEDENVPVDDLEINIRGTSRTADGANTVAHEANTIERFVGGTGSNDIVNLHREEGGLLELGDGSLVWDGVAITLAAIEKIDVRFVNDEGVRTGVVRVLADQDYTDRELRIEARGIDIRASIKAEGLSLQATNIIGIRQDFNLETGLGRLITLEADHMRIAAKNGVGDVNSPLYVKAGVLEAQTEGAAGIYLVALNDAVIGDVRFDTIGATTAGLATGAGGNIHLVNLAGVLTVDQAIQATGGRVVITSQAMDINAEISSVREIGGQIVARGTLVLQSLSTRSSIGMATTGGQTLHFTATEIGHFMNGFDSSSPASFISNGRLVTLPAVSGITIGRADGRHAITLAEFTYTEEFTFRAPESSGRFNIIGTLILAPSIIDGQNPSLTFLG
jgi:Ca2+-binding RTX toxin-like protein